MRSVIKAPWILDEEHFLAAPVFMSRPPTRREMHQKDEELILRGSPTSTIGRGLKTETRCFNQHVHATLGAVFDGLTDHETQDGRRVVVHAGPGLSISSLYRALVFQSSEPLERALEHPDIGIRGVAEHSSVMSMVPPFFLLQERGAWLAFRRIAGTSM
jgi:hypothetical protein